MENIQYIGEHIWAGNLGRLLLILSFSFSLLASFLYFLNSRDQQNTFLAGARLAFRVHSAVVILAIGLLFFMIANHYFEYHYVWQHSNREMPMRYIFACFWEGQEGSFLLWIFWHVVLGNLLLRWSKEWESPVMTIFSLIQVFLGFMLLGIYIGDYNLGSNPFALLLREHKDFLNIPLFSNPRYLDQLDGRGLNPLLQNYWMTIHPPTLFLGFASTAVPFCFALAGLWKNKFSEWVKPALPWAYFSMAVLGTGILMGGAWAYEALSFGGFWAWDPVENASLVPWLTLVAGVHVMMVVKNKNSSHVPAFLLIILTFIFVLYSTFLTRSGILGESSVHSFTDLGLYWQLLIFLLAFKVLAIVLLVVKVKKMPSNQDDSFWSREFWMFIGALILLASAIQMTFSTSIPVINKLFSTKLAPPSNIAAHYHQFQLPIAILLSLLMGFAQYLKYKKNNVKAFFKNLIFAFLGAFLLVILTYKIFPFNGLKISTVWRVLKVYSFNDFEKFSGVSFLNLTYYYLLLFFSIFAILANLDYINKILKNNFSKAGASISHVGFLLILVGALISQGQQEVISVNTSGIDVQSLGKDLKNKENILLYKGDTLQMGQYFVTYQGKHKEGINVLYRVDYVSKKDGQVKKEFSLFPHVQTNPRMGNVSEPDTRHFIEKDIYTHVTYALLEEMDTSKNGEYQAEPKVHKMHERDTFFTSSCMIVLEGINKAVNSQDLGLQKDDIAVGAFLRIMDTKGLEKEATPVFVVSPTTGHIHSLPSEVEELGLKFVFQKIDPKDSSFDIAVYEKNSNFRDFIVMKAIVFPGINILWIGCFIMVMGIAIAIISKVQSTKHKVQSIETEESSPKES